MRLEFTNSQMDIWTKNEAEGLYAICVKISKKAKRNNLAKQINTALQYYPADTRFKAGETPIFRFKASQIERIATTSPLMKEILTQITKGTR